MIKYKEFHDAGFHVFGIHGVTNGVCNCGNAGCVALHKHPIKRKWQNTPHWPDARLISMESMGEFKHGFGVLVKGYLIIDVDARNGGVESFKKLIEDFPTVRGSGLVVETGSGGGSMHVYFKLTAEKALKQKLEAYPGIDFKSTGYVVGPGSEHKSGNRYKVVHGGPEHVTDAPVELVKALEKSKTIRADYNGAAFDVGDSELRSMLSVLSPDCGYAQWLKIGMAIHHTTGGSADGESIFDEWSRQGATYNSAEEISAKWQSFGKEGQSELVTVASIIQLAKAAGWVPPVSSIDTECLDYFVESADEGLPFPLETIDLRHPPGMVGEVAQWLDRRSISKRENLAVATALTAVGNMYGLYYKDDLSGVTLNLMAFCVASSGTGKESMLGGFAELLEAAGMGGVVHGKIKSEQEMVRNLIYDQAACYAIDEAGLMFSKIANATKKGGAPYLEGIVGKLMELFTKCSSSYKPEGDLRREMVDELLKKIAHAEKKIEMGENIEANTRYLDRLKARVKEVKTKGIVNPFLSMVGFTTPETFNGLITPDMVKNGFMSRALLFQEQDTNPKPRAFMQEHPLPAKVTYLINQTFGPEGKFAVKERDCVEYREPKHIIQTEEAAKKLLAEDISEYFWKMGERQKEGTGFEAISRRGYELTSKVSAILAAPTGIRTEEHVKWAFKLVLEDLKGKEMLALSNDESRSTNEKIIAKLYTKLDDGEGKTVNVLHHAVKDKLGVITKELIQETLELLEDEGKVRREEVKKGKHKTVRWFLN